jgi:arsenate reductase
MSIILYHNPRCSTSRAALAHLREHGIEPTIIDYQKTPLTRDELATLAQKEGISTRELLRSKEPLYRELGLDDPALGDDALLDALAAHPILLNRPIAATASRAIACRPAERVLELLAS